jgi:hypothetical protein
MGLSYAEEQVLKLKRSVHASSLHCVELGFEHCGVGPLRAKKKDLLFVYMEDAPLQRAIAVPGSRTPPTVRVMVWSGGYVFCTGKNYGIAHFGSKFVNFVINRLQIYCASFCRDPRRLVVKIAFVTSY